MAMNWSMAVCAATRTVRTVTVPIITIPIRPAGRMWITVIQAVIRADRMAEDAIITGMADTMAMAAGEPRDG